MGADGLGEGEKKLVETGEFLEIQQFHQCIVYVAAEELGGTVGEPKIHPSTNHREDRCYEGVESLEECIELMMNGGSNTFRSSVLQSSPWRS